MEPFNQHKWIVFVAAVAVAFFDYGIASSFGALYIAMLDTFNAGRANTALVQSLLFTFCWGFSVISGLLISKLGIKVGTYCGAVLACIGFPLSYFATSVYHLYVFISVLMGAGGATMYVAAVLCVGRSFSGKQKSIAISVQSIGTAISGFVWPRLSSIALEAYGLRGTFLILGGLFLHNIVFAIVFANTYGKEKTNDNNEKESSTHAMSEYIIERSDIRFEADLHNVTDGTADIGDIKDDKNIEAFSNIDKAIVWTVKDMGNGQANNKSSIENHPCGVLMQTGTSRDNFDYLNNIYTHTEMVDNNKMPKIPKGVCKSVSFSGVTKSKEFSCTSPTDFKPLKRCLNPLFRLYFVYTLACILHMSTLAGFLTVYQDINVSNGLSIVQSDLSFMCYSLFNVVSRLLPIIPAQIRCINPFAISVTSSLCGFIGQMILFSATPSMATTITALCFSGIADGGWVASMQAIIFEILPVERQAVGFGFVLTAMGVVSAGSGPLFGFIRDNSASFDTVLIITTSTFGVSALLVCLCLLKSSRITNKTRL